MQHSTAQHSSHVLIHSKINPGQIKKRKKLTAQIHAAQASYCDRKARFIVTCFIREEELRKISMQSFATLSTTCSFTSEASGQNTHRPTGSVVDCLQFKKKDALRPERERKIFQFPSSLKAATHSVLWLRKTIRIKLQTLLGAIYSSTRIL